MHQTILFLRPLCLAVLLPAAAMAQDIQIESHVPGIAARAIDELPANPAPIDPMDYCLASAWGDPTTEAGKQVAAAGWGVVSEYERDGYGYVAFVGTTTPGTSGSCLLENGNIGIFRDGGIVGLVYGDDAEKTYGVARANLLETGGLRIFDGDYLSMPVGDLTHDESGHFVMGPVAARDEFCDGAASVPTLYHQPITEGRKLLLADGWLPNPASAETREGWMDYMRDMADNGLEEVHECAGTGFGFCNFQYRHAEGWTLDVTTVGEGMEGKGPAIVGYNVACE